MLIDFRERGREGEREKNIGMREKHWLAVSHMHPNQRPNPQPRDVPWPGIEPVTFQFTGQCSSQLSHTGQSLFQLLNIY